MEYRYLLSKETVLAIIVKLMKCDKNVKFHSYGLKKIVAI